MACYGELLFDNPISILIQPAKYLNQSMVEATMTNLLAIHQHEPAGKLNILCYAYLHKLLYWCTM